MLRYLLCASMSMFVVSAPAVAAASVASATADLTRQDSRLRFEPNLGQFDPSIRFRARGREYDVAVTDAGPVLTTRDGTDLVALATTGGNRPRAISGVELLRSRSAYLQGNDSTKWLTNVPHYAQVVAKEVYRGIDLLYYTRDGRLEFDFVVAPQQDPSQVSFRLNGASAPRLAPSGDIFITFGDGELRLHAPRAYQDYAGTQRDVRAAYRVTSGGAIAFDVGVYDSTRTLVIDPIVSFATFIGGSGDDVISDVAVDLWGFVYVAGTTKSTDFPQKAAQQASGGGASEAFVAKYTRDGELLFSTYLGGDREDTAVAVAVNVTGVYITGGTTSSNFPTTAGVFRPTRPCTFISSCLNIFVAKLATESGTPVYSTFVGGDGESRDIAVDKAGAVYITGGAPADHYPFTTGAYDTEATDTDAFVTKINAAGSGLVYSTFIGKDDPQGYISLDIGNAIAVDSDGNASVVGYTQSRFFPVTNAFQSTPGGASGWPHQNYDAFVAKVNPAGTGLVYASYLGGSSDDSGHAAAIDEEGNLYAAGRTVSSQFPISADPYGSAGGGFITKVSPAGQMLYSTYVTAPVGAMGLFDNYIYVAGTVSHLFSFPIVDGIQTTNGGETDAYLSVFNRKGTALLFSTYYGGSSSEFVYGCFVDTSGTAYLAGKTSSANFPTRVAAQNAKGGGEDGFLTKISLDKDGDGLLDMWEERGLDVNDDGTIDLNLPALGANQNHKDIFVEIDFMVDPNHTHRPDAHPSGVGMLTSSATAAVTTAFAAAPVTNPDGHNGIRLHLLVDEPIPEVASLTFSAGTSGFNTIKHGSPVDPCLSGHFGTPGDRQGDNCRHVINAKRRVYHYGIFAHEHGDAPGRSGAGEMPGNDFMINMPVAVPGPNNDAEDYANSRAASFGTTFDVEFSDMQAGVFMHELGHNLGLNHGGGIGIANVIERGQNYKPNYLSVMNYAFQSNTHGRDAVNTNVRIRTERPLDYSRSTLTTLDENALNELVGVGGPVGRRTLFGQGINGLPRIAAADGSIDWNGTNGLEASVGADVNYIIARSPSSRGEKLVGHDDWKHLIYDFRASPHYADGARDDAESITDETQVFDGGLTPPVCSLVAPANGATFAAPATLTIEAAATPFDGATITRVEFYAGSTKIHEDSTAPFTFTWNNVAAGSYRLSARAFDSFGLAGLSNEADVRVGPCSVPVVATEPADVVVERGAVTRLTLATTGSGPLSYRWYRGAVGVTTSPVSNGTGAALLLAPSETGTYWCRVSNACGTDDSRVAKVSLPISGPTSEPEPVGDLVITSDNKMYWTTPPVRSTTRYPAASWSASGAAVFDAARMNDGDLATTAAEFGAGETTITLRADAPLPFREVEIYWSGGGVRPELTVLYANAGAYAEAARCSDVSSTLTVCRIASEIGPWQTWAVTSVSGPTAISSMTEVRFRTYSLTTYAHASGYRLSGNLPSPGATSERNVTQTITLSALPTAANPVDLNAWTESWQTSASGEVFQQGTETVVRIATISASGVVSDSRAAYTRRVVVSTQAPTPLPVLPVVKPVLRPRVQ